MNIIIYTDTPIHSTAAVAISCQVTNYYETRIFEINMYNIYVSGRIKL